VIDLKICEDKDSSLSQYLVSFSYDNSILFIKLETLRIELTHIFEFHEKGIFNCLDFFDNFLIFGCEDGYLRFFHFEDSKLKFICKKHYLPKVKETGSEFRTINTLKVFEDLLLVADNFGGLMVLDLKRLIDLVREFIRLKNIKQKQNQQEVASGSKLRDYDKPPKSVKKKHLQVPDYNFKDFGIDIDFDWQLIFIEQCHFQKIVKIMDLDGQAILTSGNDCKTKLWVVTRQSTKEMKERGINVNVSEKK
jgi:hypothetical protein